jgi:restriction endonuclease
MDPEDYEHLVAHLLTEEGWEAHVTPYRRDFGLDVIAERRGIRLGVQVKMWAGANRRIAGPEVMQLHGAAAYEDCSKGMIVTDSAVLDHAREIAEKLGIEIRLVPSAGIEVPASKAARARPAELRFGQVWREHIVPLAGATLTRPNGKTNEILEVDWAGVVRRTSRGGKQRIDVEIFRWAIERLLHGETVSREEINDHYPRRASSGIALILSSVPLFESTRIDRKECLRLRTDPAA